MVSGLLSRHQEQPKQDARQHGKPKTAMRVDFAVGPRHQPDAHQRQRKSGQLKAVRHAFGADTDQNRQDSRDHGGDGRDDAHASDGERLVKGGDAECARDPRNHAPLQRRAGRERLAREPRQQQHQHQSAGVRARDDAKHVGALGGDAAGEIASSPNCSRAETEGSTCEGSKVHSVVVAGSLRKPNRRSLACRNPARDGTTKVATASPEAIVMILIVCPNALCLEPQASQFRNL